MEMMQANLKAANESQFECLQFRINSFEVLIPVQIQTVKRSNWLLLANLATFSRLAPLWLPLATHISHKPDKDCILNM